MSRLEKTVGARSVLTLLLITVLLRFGLETGLMQLVDTETLRQPEVYYALSMLLSAMALGLPVLLFIYLFRPRYAPVLKAQLAFPPFSAVARTVLAAMAGAVMLQLYLTLWALLLEALHVPMNTYEVPLPQNTAQIILAMIAVGVLPAILEELLFRGALLEGLRRELPLRTALIMSALLFALMHGMLEGLPAHIAIGFVLGLLAIRQNSLQLPMVYHFTHNASTLLLSMYLQKMLDGVEASAQETQTIDGAALFSAVTGVLAMAAAFTFLFIVLLRPLLSAKEVLPRKDVLPTPETGLKNRKTVFLLTAVLLLLLLPSYVLQFFPG